MVGQSTGCLWCFWEPMRGRWQTIMVYDDRQRFSTMMTVRSYEHRGSRTWQRQSPDPFSQEAG
jgi:hypothetical protein